MLVMFLNAPEKSQSWDCLRLRASTFDPTNDMSASAVLSFLFFFFFLNSHCHRIKVLNLYGSRLMPGLSLSATERK